MRTLQLHLSDSDAIGAGLQALQPFDPDLVLCFGDPVFFRCDALHVALKAACPRATLAGCSGAGEILQQQVHDGTLAVTALKFDIAQVHGASTRIAGMADSFGAGARLGATLPHAGLRHVLLWGTGVQVNGSALVEGLQSTLPAGVAVSGGLAGDRGAFVETFTLGNQGSAFDQIVAVGLYGESLAIGNSSFGGWVPFGPARRITRCDHNVLYELDGERALNIYKRYLGEYARDLPASGLLFPFELLRDNQESSGIIRTILGVDEDAGSLTLAGDVIEGGYLKLMHASTERLIDAAEHAALKLQALSRAHDSPALALLVSCVGRKLVMGDRVDEEVEAVANVLGARAAVTGFYSYGEISASEFVGDCRLHNQTMTITWLTERGQD
jgi:hypothetical protein